MRVDLSEVSTNKELHEVLAQALKFPDFYGYNWDAFWDAITGLVEMPKQLTFLGWNKAQERLPKDTATLLELLQEKNLKYPSERTKLELKDHKGVLIAEIPIHPDEVDSPSL